LSLITPFKNNQKSIIKGCFYRYSFVFPFKKIVIVRPLYDSTLDNTTAADILPLNECNDSFNHKEYEAFQLDTDEEFILCKAKYRRVLAITHQNTRGYVTVVPVYTLKDYHKKEFDYEKLKENQIAGLIYLEPNEETNEESIINLTEPNTAHFMQLKPINLILNGAGINLLDDQLAVTFDLYADSTE
jgi:hypothetical protein